MDLSKTNIENEEQFDALLKRIIEWYVSIKHPGYKVVEIERKVKDHEDVV